MAANDGNPFCQFLLGILYKRGTIVDANVDLACRWFKLAAHNGNARAALAMASLSKGSELDRWIDLAADLGSKHGCYLSAMRNLAGSPKRAADLLLKAAKAGDGLAMVSFAMQCDDVNQQTFWMEEAASLGVPRYWK
jgi:hypothetical protein